MAKNSGPSSPGSSAEVPHPEGVRDLRRDRLALAADLAAREIGGADRRRIVGELTLARLAQHWESLGAPHTGVALGALGSVARGDAGPASDLDLVLLHDGSTLGAEDLAALAQRLWYPIWDAGIPLDHSVRSLADCRKVASSDLAAGAALIDLSRVGGDGDLVGEARSAILADWRSAARTRLPELLESSRARAERFGELAYLIEPNLKESRGGLRDYGSLSALAATWLADRPHGDVDKAAEHVLDVRDALQLEAERPQVILARHLAPRVARRVGLRNADELLASLADAGRRVAFALDVTERDARRALTTSARGSRALVARLRHVAPRHVEVAPGLIEIDGDLALAPDARPERDALLPLRVAATAAATGFRPTPGLLDAVRRCPDLPTPWPPEALESFLALLAGSRNLVAVWEALDLAGCIVRWIPEWEGVRNRPQRNPVHHFTVDRHSVETVAVAGPLVGGASRPNLVLIAALFHDIGKRAGASDHSTTGAGLIPAIGARLGLPPSEVNDLRILVRHHLLLATLATTSDPSSRTTAQTLLASLGNRADLFEDLRVLTEADAIAAGPRAWNPWREKLFATLTHTVRAELAANAGASSR